MSKRNLIVEEHWRKSYPKYVKMVTYRVPNNSKQIAEEVVQEAYCKAMTYFRTFNPELSAFDTWFSRILNNCVNKKRLEESGGGSTKEVDAETPSLGITKDEKELLNLLLQDINSLVGLKRDVLTMFYFNGFKTVEIADFLNKKHSTVRQIIFQWRSKVGLDEVPTPAV